MDLDWFWQEDRFGTVLAKVSLYLWNSMGPLTWRNSNKPLIRVDSLAFHACRAAWRVLTTPIKVYSNAPWLSFKLIDKLPPLASARAGQGYTLSRIWRKDRGMGGVGWSWWVEATVTCNWEIPDRIGWDWLRLELSYRKAAQQGIMSRWPPGFTNIDMTDYLTTWDYSYGHKPCLF